VLGADDIKRNMFRDRPDTEEGLAALYIFDADGVKSVKAADSSDMLVATDRSGARRGGWDGGCPRIGLHSRLCCAATARLNHPRARLSLCRAAPAPVPPFPAPPAANGNHLQLRATPPEWVYSYAPLASPDGAPVQLPTPGKAGYAMRLHDNQVRGDWVGDGAWRRAGCWRPPASVGGARPAARPLPALPQATKPRKPHSNCPPNIPTPFQLTPFQLAPNKRSSWSPSSTTSRPPR
jgi:hypothetical protein